MRCIGEVKRDKVRALRSATKAVEGELGRMSPAPKQYLAAITEDDRVPAKDGVGAAASRALKGAKVEYFRGLATGVKGDNRAYGKMALVTGEGVEPESIFDLPNRIIHQDGDVVRALYRVGPEGNGNKDGKYAVIVRAVETRDFMTVKPSAVPLRVLEAIAKKVLADKAVTLVCYDITSKPPATVEFE